MCFCVTDDNVGNKNFDKYVDKGRDQRDKFSQFNRSNSLHLMASLLTCIIS